MFTINCKGKLLGRPEPLLMGILNVTPDSFYKGYLNDGIPSAVLLAGKMLEDGADIIDVGGQSSRPGSERISPQQETDRVIPVINAILSTYKDAVISIDTYYAEVAAAAVNAGAAIVNDISAGEMDHEMIPTVASLKVPFVCMHMKGRPETMQQNIFYENLVTEVLDFFINKITACERAGVADIIIDPGFGFGKTIEHNFKLLSQLHLFKMLDKPILAGLSRKSTIYKTLGTTVENALNGTTVLNTIALEKGANILRVHDVKEAKEAIQLFSAYKKAAS